jgi:hypothetical protein
MGTKKHHKKQKKKMRKKIVYKGGDLPAPGQDPGDDLPPEKDPKCVSYLGKTCTECKPGYVPVYGNPVYGKNNKHCAPALGSTADLQHILPNSLTAHTSDGDYTLEGSKKPGKKYDATLCKKGFTPVGPIGERRCESMYVPIDKDDVSSCQDKIRDDCTVCKMVGKTMMVPAGPLLHRRCIKTGQLWNGEYGKYDNTKLYTKRGFFTRMIDKLGNALEGAAPEPEPEPVYQPEPAQPAYQQEQARYQPEQARYQPERERYQPERERYQPEQARVYYQQQPAQPAVPNVVQKEQVTTAVPQPVPSFQYVPNVNAKPMYHTRDRPIIIKKYVPIIRYRNKQTRKKPRRMIYKNRRNNGVNTRRL